MDLGTIRTQLETGLIPNISVYADRVRLVFRNALQYNVMVREGGREGGSMRIA